MNWYLQCAVFKVQSDWTFASHSITESYFFSHNLSSFFCYRITGKTSLSTALPCRFWVSHRFLWLVLSQTASCSFSSTPVFCNGVLNVPLIFSFYSGSHLPSHIVSNTVLLAVQVLTVVFGMGTGVSPERIATRNLSYSFFLHQNQNTHNWTVIFSLSLLILP